MRHPVRRTFFMLCGVGVVASGVYLIYTPSGCTLLSAVPYCDAYAAEIHKVKPVVAAFFAPMVRWVGDFVRGHLSVLGGGYGLLVLYLLTQARYRNQSGEVFGPFFIRSVIFGVWCFGVFWASIACREIHNPGGDGILVPLHGAPGLGFLRTMAGLCTAILTIALGVTVWVLVPLYFVFCALFLLFVGPGTVWALSVFTLRAPFLLWHYLHYVFVPHPMEGVIKKYEKMRLRRGVKIDRGALAEEMERARYDDREGIPPWWKSENWARRLKNVAALRKRVKIETDVADAYTEDAEGRNRRGR